jgi:ATP synthase protein I
VTAIDLSQARRMALGIVLGQAAVTVIAALVSGSLAGSTAAISALVGGGISVAASLVMALLSLAGSGGIDAQRAVSAFYIGEAAKLGLVVVLFAVVWKTMKVSPLPLFAAYLATFLVYWVALFSMRTPSGGAAHGARPSA